MKKCLIVFFLYLFLEGVLRKWAQRKFLVGKF